MRGMCELISNERASSDSRSSLIYVIRPAADWEYRIIRVVNVSRCHVAMHHHVVASPVYILRSP